MIRAPDTLRAVSDPDVASPEPNPDGITVRDFRETQSHPRAGQRQSPAGPTAHWSHRSRFETAVPR